MNDLNTLKIHLPYEFLKKTINISWCDILFGINNNYLNEDNAIDYAIDLLSDEKYLEDDMVMKIAILQRGDSTISYIEKIVDSSCIKNEQETKEKFLYSLLSFVYENKEKYDDSFEMVEVIYEDFGCPNEISSFVRYMPIKEPPLSTKELNEKRMYQYWKDYLNFQSKKYGKKGL